jgi:hypothetical protein
MLKNYIEFLFSFNLGDKFVADNVAKYSNVLAILKSDAAKEAPAAVAKPAPTFKAAVADTVKEVPAAARGRGRPSKEAPTAPANNRIKPAKNEVIEDEVPTDEDYLGSDDLIDGEVNMIAFDPKNKIHKEHLKEQILTILDKTAEELRGNTALNGAIAKMIGKWEGKDIFYEDYSLIDEAMEEIKKIGGIIN